MALPSVRFSIGIPFPTAVLGLGFMSIAKANGVWSFKVDYTKLAALSAPVDTSKQVAVFDPVSGAYNVVSLATLGLPPPVQFSRVAADFSKTSDTALAAITGLSANLIAGHNYAIEVDLHCVSANTGGVKFDLSGTATCSAVIYEGILFEANAVVEQQRAAALGTTINAHTTALAPLSRITGLVTCSVSGTLTARFAQNASNGTPSTVKQGSWMRVTDVT